MVPGIEREFVVSDCEVPTPELSLITSDAVSPRLLSKKIHGARIVVERLVLNRLDRVLEP